MEQGALTGLILWAFGQLGEPGLAVPAVDLVSAADLRVAFVAENGPAAVSGHEVAALYRPSENVILLPDSFDPADPSDRSLLVHEAVHAVQYQTGRAAQVRCPGQLEDQAYAIQARWLRLQGLEAQAGRVRVLGAFLSVCARGD